MWAESGFARDSGSDSAREWQVWALWGPEFAIGAGVSRRGRRFPPPCQDKRTATTSRSYLAAHFTHNTLSGTLRRRPAGISAPQLSQVP